MRVFRPTKSSGTAAVTATSTATMTFDVHKPVKCTPGWLLPAASLLFGSPPREGQPDSSPGQRSPRPAPWGTEPPIPIFTFPVLTSPFIAGFLCICGCSRMGWAKQEKGRVCFSCVYPGRRFALHCATIALSFQDAIFVATGSALHLAISRRMPGPSTANCSTYLPAASAPELVCG